MVVYYLNKHIIYRLRLNTLFIKLKLKICSITKQGHISLHLKYPNLQYID